MLSSDGARVNVQVVVERDVLSSDGARVERVGGVWTNDMIDKLRRNADAAARCLDSFVLAETLHKRRGKYNSIRSADDEREICQA